MYKGLRDIRKSLRLLVANHAFLAVAGTAVLGIAANAELLSTIHTYAGAERVASGVVSVLTLVHLLFSVWFGIHALC